MHYSGPWGDAIDGFESGEEVITWIDDDAPVLELNRAVKMGECYQDRYFRTTHPDLKDVAVEQLMGTNVIFYY